MNRCWEKFKKVKCPHTFEIHFRILHLHQCNTDSLKVFYEPDIVFEGGQYVSSALVEVWCSLPKRNAFVLRIPWCEHSRLASKQGSWCSKSQDFQSPWRRGWQKKWAWSGEMFQIQWCCYRKNLVFNAKFCLSTQIQNPLISYPRIRCKLYQNFEAASLVRNYSLQKFITNEFAPNCLVSFSSTLENDNIVVF